MGKKKEIKSSDIDCLHEKDCCKVHEDEFIFRWFKNFRKSSNRITSVNYSAFHSKIFSNYFKAENAVCCISLFDDTFLKSITFYELKDE